MPRERKGASLSYQRTYDDDENEQKKKFGLGGGMKDLVSKLASAAKSMSGNPFAKRGAVPPDTLTDTDPFFIGHSGLPESAHVMQYDNGQRLLAVACDDGIIKVIGGPGAESLLRGGDESDTTHMVMVPAKAALVRCCNNGDVELWDLETQECSHVIEVDDHVTVVATLNKGDEQAPYVFLGMKQGNIQVVQVSTRNGSDKQLDIMPYCIQPEDCRSEGEVVSIQAQPHGEFARVLIAHKNSGARIWDLHLKRCTASAADPEEYGRGTEFAVLAQAGPVSAACWVGNNGQLIATGHERGDVLVWKVPPVAQNIANLRRATPCELHVKQRVVAREMNVRPIRCMAGLGGSSKAIMVQGGGAKDQPDTLTLLPCEEISATVKRAPNQRNPGDTGPSTRDDGPLLVGARQIPNFGTLKSWMLVPYDGHFTLKHKPAKGVIALVEAGKVVYVDFKQFEPKVLPATALDRSKLTASGFFMLPERPPVVAGNVTSPGGGRPRKLFSNNGRGGAARGGKGGRKGAADEDDAPHEYGLTIRAIAQARVMERNPVDYLRQELFGGGVPADEQSLFVSTAAHLLVTGHQDGFVRFFDGRMETPGQISICPNPEDRYFSERKKKMGSVTKMDMCLASGQLVVGHDNGEVRFYKWSDVERTRPGFAIHKDIQAVPLDATVYQNPGWQFHFQSAAHRAPITSLRLSSALSMMVAADSAGFISLTDCSDSPEVLLVIRTLGPVKSVDLLFLGDVLLAPRALERTYDVQDLEDIHSLKQLCCIVALLEDASICMYDLEGAQIVTAPEGFVGPKNASTGVSVHPLSARGAPCPDLYRWRAFKWRPLSTKPEKAPEPVVEAESEPEPDDSQARNLTAKKKKGVKDEDDDDFLAAAAAQAETKQRRTRGGAAAKNEEAPPRTGRRTGRTLVKVDSQGFGSGEGEAGPLGNIEEARFLLTVCRESLRIYNTRAVMDGSRKRLRKGRIPSDEETEIVMASVFEADSGVGIATLMDSGSLFIYSCPGLELLTRLQISDIVGWRFEWTNNDDENPETIIQTSSVSRDGQMCVFPECGDMTRLALTPDMPEVFKPQRIFDEDVQAAVKAAASVAEAQNMDRFQAPTGPTVVDQYADIGKDVAKSFAGLGSSLLPTRLLGKGAKDNLKGAGEDFVRGMTKAANKTVQAATTGALIPGVAAGAPGRNFYTVTDLDVLFSSSLPPATLPRREMRGWAGADTYAAPASRKGSTHALPKGGRVAPPPPPPAPPLSNLSRPRGRPAARRSETETEPESESPSPPPPRHRAQGAAGGRRRQVSESEPESDVPEESETEPEEDPRMRKQMKKHEREREKRLAKVDAFKRQVEQEEEEERDRLRMEAKARAGVIGQVKDTIGSVRKNVERTARDVARAFDEEETEPEEEAAPVSRMDMIRARYGRGPGPAPSTAGRGRGAARGGRMVQRDDFDDDIDGGFESPPPARKAPASASAVRGRAPASSSRRAAPVYEDDDDDGGFASDSPAPPPRRGRR